MAARAGKKKIAQPRTRRKAVAPGKAKNSGLAAELADARAQQAASAQILRAIARSRTDERPAFKAIVENAHRLCGAIFSVLYRYDGKSMTVVADKHLNPKSSRALRGQYPAPPRKDHIVGRAILERRTMHSKDVTNDRRFPGNRNAFMSSRAAAIAPTATPSRIKGTASTARR